MSHEKHHIVAEEKNLWQKFVEVMKRELDDLSYLEIVTASGDPITEIDPENNARDVVAAIKGLRTINVLARTRIELDGDIAMIVPSGAAASAPAAGGAGGPAAGDAAAGGTNIDQEVLAIHTQNVTTAVSNWNSLIINILRALDILVSMARGTAPNLEQFAKDIAPVKG